MNTKPLVVLPALLAWPLHTAAQPHAAYPSRAVRFIVPYPSGGATDILARLTSGKLAAALGQQFVVDNRSGAGQKIGTQLAARAAPDGHTILLVSVTHSINPALDAKLPYDTVKDFVPIVLLASSPLILFTHPGVNAATTRELIALAKAQPNALNMATSGNGSGGHLAGELFMAMAGVRMNVVPYKGGALAYIDLMSGSVQTMFTSPNPTLSYAKAGKLRALATTGQKRTVAAPELPTVAESGDLPGYESALWYGVVAPAGTPRHVVQTLNAEMNKALQQADVKEPLAAQAVDVAGGTPEAFAGFIASEMKKWAKVIKDANIVVR